MMRSTTSISADSIGIMWSGIQRRYSRFSARKPVDSGPGTRD